MSGVRDFGGTKSSESVESPLIPTGSGLFCSKCQYRCADFCSNLEGDKCRVEFKLMGKCEMCWERVERMVVWNLTPSLRRPFSNWDGIAINAKINGVRIGSPVLDSGTTLCIWYQPSMME